MNEVVMKKSELLKKLVENKAKHDVILATAIEGYWDMAKEKLEARRVQFIKQICEYQEDMSREVDKVFAAIESKQTLPQRLDIKAFLLNTDLGLVYPQDHSRDYERAIRAMEASIYEEVRLSMDEFDAYVLNNWEWKNNFLALNSTYVDNLRTKYKRVSGMNGPQGPSGISSRYDDAYSQAVASASQTLLYSGCAINTSTF